MPSYSARYEKKLEAYVAAEFDKDNLTEYFSTNSSTRSDIFNLSYNNFASSYVKTYFHGVCAERCALCSVIGRRQLNMIKRHLSKGNLRGRRPTTTFDSETPLWNRSVWLSPLCCHTRRGATFRYYGHCFCRDSSVTWPRSFGPKYLYPDNVNDRVEYPKATSKPGDPITDHDLCHSEEMTARTREKSFPNSRFSTARQLKKLLRQFAHQSVDKINKIQRTRLEAVESLAHQIWYDIAARLSRWYWASE